MIIKDRQELGTWSDEILDYGIIKYIGHFALIVYLALRRHANSNRSTPLFLTHLMQECYLDKKTIAKSIRLLKRYRLLEVVRQKPQENIYIVRAIPDTIQLNQWPKITEIERVQATQSQPQSQFQPFINNSPSFSQQPPTPHPNQIKVPPLILTKDCPYCNERGLLHLVDKDNGHFQHIPCSHDPDRIKFLVLSKRCDIIIASAKPGYQELVKRDPRSQTQNKVNKNF